MDNLIAFLLAVSATAAFAAPVNVKFDLAKPGHAVPKTLYGIFFEDINWAADGGIYPEQIANRGFDWDTKELEGWVPDFRGGAMARITRQYGKPVNEATAMHLRIEAFGAGTGCGVRNDGFDGIAVKAGAKYDLSFYARGLDGYAGGVRVVLEAKDGKELASYEVANADMTVAPKDPARLNAFTLPDWKRYTAVFSPAATATDAHLSVLMDKEGAVEVEQVSLFPQETFNNRPNGLRPDIVQLLKDMKPGIMRFPGGCLTEGHDFASWYDWKRSVGDGSLESRKVVWNTWGYWQTFGLGYFEYLCLCEDIGCEALPVMGAGLTCQFRHAQAAPMEAMGYFADNMCDLIEFANGETSTKWGALRAKMGHPKPFNLHYIGIGNENWDRIFLERYLAIEKLVKAKHPEIRVVSSAGAGPDGANFDLAWKTLKPSNADVVDEHYYVPAQWLLDGVTRYDNRDRNACKVYAGEYACHLPNRANNLYSALCEAAMMTGFERNSDVVEMTSYAPLFSRVGRDAWRPNLIWYDNAKSYGTPNYYVQKLFASNRPSTYVPTTCDAAAEPGKPAGGIGIQTWHTAAEFRDIKVTAADGKVLFAPKPNIEQWLKRNRVGKWSIAGDAFAQTDAAMDNTSLLAGLSTWGDYTFTLKARKTAGDEGFLVRFRDRDGSFCRLNLGGWGNTKHAIEVGASNIFPGAEKAGKIEADKWYDVKIALSGSRVSVWLDGQPLFTDIDIPAPKVNSVFAVAGMDDGSKELIVKCVNVSEAAREAVFDFGGVSIPAQQAHRVTLTGEPDAENNLASPTHCAPVEDTIAIAGGASFKATLAPSSLTVLRFKR